MGKKYLIDSNVIIDYTSTLLSREGFEFNENILNNDFNISVIVKIEVLGYDGEKTKMDLLEKFLGLANILPLDSFCYKENH